MNESYAAKIEAKKQKAAEDIARLEKESDIASKLPEGADKPDHIMLGQSFDKAPWLCYKVKTLHDALALMRLFPQPSEISAVRSGCLSVCPPELHGKDYKVGELLWTEPTSIEIRQHGGRGFFSCGIDFWVQDFAGLAWAKINIDVDSLPYQLRASMSANYDRHGEVTTAQFHEPDLLRHAATRRVKYSGGSRDAFDIRYYFSGPDHLEDFMINHKEAA